MKHLQFLNKLSRSLVDSISYDVSRLTARQMLFGKPHAQVASSVISPALLRWNCVLEAADGEAASGYRDQAALVLALVLHKHGFHEPSLTGLSLAAIDRLNAAAAPGDGFVRASGELKTLLRTPPAPLARRPSIRKDITFWRAGEAASVQVGKRFHAIYVHEVADGREAPVVELYDFSSDRRPAARDVSGLPARGCRYKDGVDRVKRFCVYGMRDIPDPANQFHRIVGSVAAPAAGHLGEAVGLYAMSDVFRLLEDIRDSFSYGPDEEKP
jgi:hypothetical protein